MRGLTQKETRILEMLRFGNLNSKDIARHLQISQKYVQRIVANIRKKFVDGNANASYIFATKHGYSLEETPTHLREEGLMRLKIGTSTILNGKHVFNRYKQIDLGNFNTLRLEFYPKAEKIVESLTKLISAPQPQEEVIDV